MGASRSAALDAPLLVERPSLPDQVLLWLTLLQGSSVTLSLALNVSSAHAPTLATLVSAIWGLMYVHAGVALFAVFGIGWIPWLLRYRLPLALLVLGALASTIWSLDQGLSFERGAHLAGTTLVALYLGLRIPLGELLRATGHALAIILVLSVLAALLLPSLGLESYQGRDVWRGVTSSKNTLGFWSAVAALLFLSRVAGAHSLSLRLQSLAFGALALLCLGMSVSATSALALGVAALALLYLHVAAELRIGQLALMLLGVLFTGLVALAFQVVDTAELIGRSDDLTGRGQVWEETWRLILERPFGGYGYGALWFPTEQSLWIQESLTDFNWLVYHAHNGLLHLASEIGLPLTALAVLWLALQLGEGVWHRLRYPRPGVAFVTGFSVLLLVSNYSEARLLINRDLFWIFLVTLPIAVLRQTESISRHASARLARARAGVAIPEGALAIARAEQRARKRILKQRALDCQWQDEDARQRRKTA